MLSHGHGWWWGVFPRRCKTPRLGACFDSKNPFPETPSLAPFLSGQSTTHLNNTRYIHSNKKGTGCRSRWHICCSTYLNTGSVGSGEHGGDSQFILMCHELRLTYVSCSPFRVPAARLAAEHGIDLIVMGTVCRIGVAGFFIGNTAENVLQQADCSVLTIKPEGFVSPVKLKVA